MAIDFQPRPYQKIAQEFLLNHERCNLFADMGLGKTATVLSVIQTLELERTLIVAPLRVAQGVWPREIAKWRQFERMPIGWIGGTFHERQLALLALPTTATVHYDVLLKLMDELGGAWPFKTVVCDESTRLKGFRIRKSTKRPRMLATYAHKKVSRWINLTGTPNANGLTDLWGQQWFIDGGKALGRSYTDYTNRWFYLNAKAKNAKYQALIPFPSAQAQIEAAMKPTTLSIRARDWFDIAEPIEVDVWVDLPAKVRAKYNEMQRHFYVEFERGVVTAANCAVKVSKLLQIASGAVYPRDGDTVWTHDEKLLGLESIVEETGGAPLLVVYQFVSELERLLKWFPGAVDIRETGAQDRWTAREIPMLLCHPKSAGHGLNLQDGGHHIVFFTPTWDLELYAQVLERIGPVRQAQSGYTREVFVYHILARDTVDPVVKVRRENKGSLMDLFMDRLRSDGHPVA